MDQLQILVNDLCTALRDPAATEETVRPAATNLAFWMLDNRNPDTTAPYTPDAMQAVWGVLKRIVQGFKAKTP